MLNKFNTLARLIIVILLAVPIYPIAPALAVEVTETETFDGSNGSQVTDLGIPTNTGTIAIRNDQNCCGVGGQYFLSLKDNYSGSAQATSYTFTLPYADHNITELGFRMSGVNHNYTIQYNYSDSTSDTISYNAQNNSTYEDITRTISGKYFTTFIVTVSDWSGIDTIYWKYDDGLTAGVGPATNLATTQNLHSGAVGLTWTAPTGYSNTPERYAVAFSNDNFQNTNFAVATTTDSGDTSYTFSKQYLLSTFTDLAVGDTLYFKVRSDDDTNSLYSSWTDVVTYTIPDVASGVSTLTANQDNQYVGVIFYWTQPNTGWATQTSYKLAYKDSDDTEFTYVTGISADATNYTWTGVLEDTYEFLIYACTQNDSWCHGPQNGSISVDIVSTTPTTTIVYTLGPPMNPTVDNVYDDGVLVEWDEPNTGNGTATSYELYYRTSAEDEVKIENITETEYTIPYANIPNGTYEFSIRAIDSNNSINSGYSTEPTLTVFDQKAQDDANDAAEAQALAQAQAEAQAEADRVAAAVQWERDQNYAETGVSETDSERRDRESRTFIVGGEETEYTQGEVDDGTVERDQERQKNLELYGVELTDEQILRGDAGDIELIEEDENTEGTEFPEDDNLVFIPEDEDYDDDIIYEVYDEDEGWVEVSEEEFEEIIEFEAEKDAKELEVLETYDLEQLEDLNLYIPENELEGLTEEEILEIEREFEEFIETIIVIEEYLEEFEDEDWLEPVVVLDELEFEDVIIIVIEEPEDLPRDNPNEDLPPKPIVEDFPDELPPEELTDLEIILEEELSEEEIDVLTEEEYEEYKEERQEVIDTYVEELEEEIIEEILPETVTVEEFEEIKEKEVEELSVEEVELVVEVVEQIIEEVVNVEELEEVISSEDIVILEEEEIQELSEEDLEIYEEELEEVIEEYVEELATEELVVVVEQVAEVSIQNLAVADTQTQKVVQAVVSEVTSVETVAELNEEQKEAVGEVLGFVEESAAEDVEIIAQQAAKDENTAQAVEEFVERAIENKDVENFTLADVVTEVQVEAFLENPIAELTSVNIDIREMDLESIGADMTSDQKEKAQEVVVPIIIASQIVAQAGALITRRF